MSTSESTRALRRANPRTKAGFEQAVEAATEAVRERIADDHDLPPARSRSRPAFIGIAAGAALAAVAALVLLVGSPGGGTGVENAAAAFEKAATITAASAERSGTAVVRMTHDGELWSARTIRWNGSDLATSRNAPWRNSKAEPEWLVVDGMMYGIDPAEGGWFELGSPNSIDPGSGTTPAEYLAAVREDIGGATLRRFTNGMKGLTTKRLGDGSTVYSGTVAAGLVARETGFKEGRAIRVLPFGYVAHDEAANAQAPLDVAVTVGPEGVLRTIEVSWGTWTYTVSYSGLGSTPAPRAPKNAKPFPDRRPR
jgi:hypothetical protein